MKIYRKHPLVEVRPPSDKPPQPPAPESLEVLASVATATNVMIQEVANATASVAESLDLLRPGGSFKCIVTSRDENGRIVEMDIRRLG